MKDNVIKMLDENIKEQTENNDIEGLDYYQELKRDYINGKGDMDTINTLLKFKEIDEELKKRKIAQDIIKKIKKGKKMKKDEKKYILKLNEKLFVESFLKDGWGVEFTDVKSQAQKFNFKDAEYECDFQGFTMEEYKKETKEQNE